MTLLNTANKIYYGANAASKVYAGSVKVWPSYPSVLDTAASWIDATQDTFTDGQTITSYTEHSVNHRVFSGNSAVNYRASIDGKPRIHLNGGWMKYPGYTPPASGFTFVMVRRITGPSPSSAIGMPMVYNEDAFNNYELRFNDSGTHTQLLCEYSAGYAFAQASFNETLGTDYLQWAEWNTVAGGPIRIFINNVLRGSSSFVLSGPTAKTAAVLIGARGYAGDFPAIMQVGEAVVFDGLLSDAVRTEVSNYMIAKWQI